MTTHTASGGYFLPPDDPNYPQWATMAQYEPDRRVHQLSGALIGNCPRGIRGNPNRCAEYLAGPVSAAIVQAAVASGEKTAVEHIDRAEQAKDELIHANRDLEAINVAREKLPHMPVDGPHGRRVTPAQNRTQLIQTQRVAHQRVVGEDGEHNKVAHTPVSGHIAAVVCAVIETVFTLRVFNVSLTHIVWLQFLPWLAATVGLAIFNVKVAEWLGGRRRIARETQRAAVELNTRALTRAHAQGAPVIVSLPPSAANADASSMGSLAGLAPTADAVRAAKRNRTKALAVWGIPILLLLGGLYWRLAVSTLPLQLGFVTWLLPAAIAAVVAALLWALIVEPNSRGNALGDELRASAAIDAKAVAEDDALKAQGLQAKEYGDQCAEIVEAELLEAQERVIDSLEVSHRALQVASAVLGVPKVPAVRQENLMLPTMPHIERIEKKVGTELEMQGALAGKLGVEELPALEDLPSPVIALTNPPDVAPGIEHVDPRGLRTFAGSTLAGSAPAGAPVQRHRGRRLWQVLVVLIVVALLATAVVWYLTSVR